MIRARLIKPTVGDYAGFWVAHVYHDDTPLTPNAPLDPITEQPLAAAVEFLRGTDHQAVLQAAAEAVAVRRGWEYHGGWILERVDHCTCATPSEAVFGHELMCGLMIVAPRRDRSPMIPEPPS